MARGRKWTRQESDYLVRNAGRMDAGEIARHLCRSRKSVERMAERLRNQGWNVSLRKFEPRTRICPSCGRSRSTIGDHGVCEPCRRREQLARIQAQTADLIAQLPPEEHATYEATEATIASRIDKRPRSRRSPKGMSYYHTSRDAEARDIAQERWEAEQWFRKVKAAQKRKERVMRKLRGGR